MGEFLSFFLFDQAGQIYRYLIRPLVKGSNGWWLEVVVMWEKWEGGDLVAGSRLGCFPLAGQV